jgi:hypothetical protein
VVNPEERRVVFSLRTQDDLFAVFVGFAADEVPPIRSNIEGAFMQRLLGGGSVRHSPGS